MKLVRYKRLDFRLACLLKSVCRTRTSPASTFPYFRYFLVRGIYLRGKCVILSNYKTLRQTVLVTARVKIKLEQHSRVNAL